MTSSRQFISICTSLAIFATAVRSEDGLISTLPDLSQVFDAVYVIGLKSCATRWVSSSRWVDSVGLSDSLIRVHATPFSDLSFVHPSIPVVSLKATSDAKAGQIACTVSHLRAWRDIAAHNYSTVLILEDDVTPTERLTRQLPAFIEAAHMGSATNGVPWHLMYLRAHAWMLSKHPPPAWHPSQPQLTHAEPSWGTAAYALSGAGVRYLLTRVTAYKKPLDVQLGMLQQGDDYGTKLVALDSCVFTNHGSFGCPENIRELSKEEKGACFYSASQAGFSVASHGWPSLTSPYFQPRISTV